MNLNKVLRAIDRSNSKYHAIKKQYSARFLSGHFSTVIKQDMKDEKRIFGHTLQEDLQFCKKTLKTSYYFEKSSFQEQKSQQKQPFIKQQIKKTKQQKQHNKTRPQTSKVTKRKMLTQQQQKQIWQNFLKALPYQLNTQKKQLPIQSQIFLTCHTNQRDKPEKNSKQNKQNRALIKNYRRNFTKTFDGCLSNMNFLRSFHKIHCAKISYNCNKNKFNQVPHNVSTYKIQRKATVIHNSLIKQKKQKGNKKYFVQDFKLIKELSRCMINKIKETQEKQSPIWKNHCKIINNAKLIIIDTSSLGTIMIDNCTIKHGIASNNSFNIDIQKAFSQNFYLNRLYCVLIMQQNSISEIIQESFMINFTDPNANKEKEISILILKFYLELFLLIDKNIKKIKEVTVLIQRIFSQNIHQSLQDCIQSLYELPNKQIMVVNDSNLYRKSFKLWLVTAAEAIFQDVKDIKKYPKLNSFLLKRTA